MVSVVMCAMVYATERNDMQEMVRPGIYQHYKGMMYQVVGVARHSESLEPLVVYQALYGAYGMWVRPAAMFAESVEVDGVMVPRFAYCGPGMSDFPEIERKKADKSAE